MKGGGDKYDWIEVYSQMKCMISLSRIRCMIYALLRNKGDISMAEAIISRRGWSSEGKPPPTPTFVLTTKTFTSNTSWVVPNHNGPVSVRIFGGGGGGAMGGGGGGWMNNGDLTLANRSSVQITIGDGGQWGSDGVAGHAKSGGTSSFGTWMSANGGGGAGHAGTSSSRGHYGGSGGSGGGGPTSGGTGYQFGGGGAGTYIGQGGPWGGNGGTSEIAAENGINTMSMSSIPANDRGYGRGAGLRGGGGGYGANGGDPGRGSRYPGGGGGWGKSANGGEGYNGAGGGGGGGYGKGGDSGWDGSYGGGGGSSANGGKGICIVQYYAES